jgi:hypothetical protein
LLFNISVTASFDKTLLSLVNKDLDMVFVSSFPYRAPKEPPSMGIRRGAVEQPRQTTAVNKRTVIAFIFAPSSGLAPRIGAERD